MGRILDFFRGRKAKHTDASSRMVAEGWLTEDEAKEMKDAGSAGVPTGPMNGNTSKVVAGVYAKTVEDTKKVGTSLDNVRTLAELVRQKRAIAK